MMVSFVSCWGVSMELSDFVWGTMADGSWSPHFLIWNSLVSSRLDEMCMSVTVSSDTAEIAVPARNGSHWNSLEVFFFFFLSTYILRTSEIIPSLVQKVLGGAVLKLHSSISSPFKCLSKAGVYFSNSYIMRMPFVQNCVCFHSWLFLLCILSCGCFLFNLALAFFMLALGLFVSLIIQGCADCFLNYSWHGGTNLFWQS